MQFTTERVELDIVRVSRAGEGPLGKIRITASDSLRLYFLTPILADFKTLNEGIAIEVLVGNQTLSLARDESVAAASAAIAAGLGFGYLPCMLGDITPGLIRVGPVVTERQDERWLLTHQDIRKSWRVKAFMTFCGAAVAELKPLIEGQRPLSAQWFNREYYSRLPAPMTALQTISINCAR